MRSVLQTLGLSGAGVVGLSGYGLAVEPMWRLEVTRYRVSPSHWPRGLALSIDDLCDASTFAFLENMIEVDTF